MLAARAALLTGVANAHAPNNRSLQRSFDERGGSFAVVQGQQQALTSDLARRAAATLPPAEVSGCGAELVLVVSVCCFVHSLCFFLSSFALLWR
jgi:hypothetical protein